MQPQAEDGTLSYLSQHNLPTINRQDTRKAPQGIWLQAPGRGGSASLDFSDLSSASAQGMVCWMDWPRT